MIEECKKCTGKIVNNKCPCSFWVREDKEPNIALTFERAILAYDYISDLQNETTPLTGDHHTGNCIAVFKGDHDMLMKVKQYIIDLSLEKKDEDENK